MPLVKSDQIITAATHGQFQKKFVIRIAEERSPMKEARILPARRTGKTPAAACRRKTSSYSRINPAESLPANADRPNAEVAGSNRHAVIA